MLLIAYYRVSGAKQARAAHGPAPLFDPAYWDAPGLRAQRSKVQRLRQSLLSGREKVVRVVEDVLEVESQEHRPQLALAMKYVRRHLPQPVAVVVAQLYSLARDADFLQQLAKEAELGRQMGSGFKGFLFPDLPDPQTPAQLLADLARFELEACEGDEKRGRSNPGTDRRNARTRAAAIDRAEQLRPLLAPLHANGASLRAMAGALAAAGTRTAAGQPLSPTQVRRHLERLELA